MMPISTTRPIALRRRSGLLRSGYSCGLGLLASIGILSAPRVMASPPELPPLVEPASQEHHPGKIIFAELVTPDLDVAKPFYAKLFGWTYRDIMLGKTQFAEALLDGRPVAGLVRRSLPAGMHRQSIWLTFISMPDVDAARRSVVQQGGKILFGPRSIPGLGREAVFADPQGAVFAALASSSGDPPDLLADPGSWIWSSLITSDPPSDAAFYKTIFGYELFDLDAGERSHVILASGNYARASINPPPATRPNSHPGWLDYIRVDDVGASAAKVVELGGRVLVTPHVDRHGGRIAVVADPLGAAFGLLEWPDDANAEKAK